MDRVEKAPASDELPVGEIIGLATTSLLLADSRLVTWCRRFAMIFNSSIIDSKRFIDQVRAHERGPRIWECAFK